MAITRVLLNRQRVIDGILSCRHHTYICVCARGVCHGKWHVSLFLNRFRLQHRRQPENAQVLSRWSLLQGVGDLVRLNVSGYGSLLFEHWIS